MSAVTVLPGLHGLGHFPEALDRRDGDGWDFHNTGNNVPSSDGLFLSGRGGYALCTHPSCIGSGVACEGER